jgi:hypothetical protein
MRGLDFTSWQSLLITFIGLALVTLISMGIRLLMMVTIQQRRERMNRQINERLRTLIAAYKTLGGSFTGTLTVDPAHLKDLRRRESEAGEEDAAAVGAGGSDRQRRIRDAVEGALSDIILLGTKEQVRLAARAANEMLAGRPARTDELVVSLRDFIRHALDLETIPGDVAIPLQGPARPSGAANRKGGGEGAAGGGKGGGAGGGMGGGMGGGFVAGATPPDDEAPEADSRG